MNDPNETSEDKLSDALGCFLWGVAIVAIGMIAALVLMFSQPFH